MTTVITNYPNCTCCGSSSKSRDSSSSSSSNPYFGCTNPCINAVANYSVTVSASAFSCNSGFCAQLNGTFIMHRAVPTDLCYNSGGGLTNCFWVSNPFAVTGGACIAGSFGNYVLVLTTQLLGGVIFYTVSMSNDCPHLSPTAAFTAQGSNTICTGCTFTSIVTGPFNACHITLSPLTAV